jgi:hypothetical protein
LISGGAHDNQIGGAPGVGNVISGNGRDGVRIEQNSDHNAVVGDLIGTSSDGTNPLGNGGHGVHIAAGDISAVGFSGAPDVISANSLNGVQIDAGVNGTQVIKALIGTDATGKEKAGLGNGGVNIQDDGKGTDISFNTIEGSRGAGIVVQGDVGGRIVGNIIQYNGGAGVVILSGTDDLISQNSIAFNTGRGIELDGTANNQQAAPVLTSANVSGGATTITGTLTSTPNTTFTLEFFGNTVADPSGYGQGEYYLGSITVTTDANGHASFTARFSTVYGSYVSATATDPNGDTSQFSRWLLDALSGGSGGG